MPIQKGFKVLASDIQSTIDSLNKAQKKVCRQQHGFHNGLEEHKWENLPIYGDLITYEMIAEISEVARTYLKSFGYSCNSNFLAKASNSSTSDSCNVEINTTKNYSG